MTDAAPRSLGVVTQDKEFKEVEAISEEQHTQLTDASGSIERLLYDFAWAHLTRDYLRFRELLSYHDLMHSLKLSFDRSPGRNWSAPLTSAVVNWL